MWYPFLTTYEEMEEVGNSEVVDQMHYRKVDEDSMLPSVGQSTYVEVLVEVEEGTAVA